jgi:hypothetical protein
MTDASTTRKAKVFISYSRDDITFADQLVAALEGTGFDPLIDRHSIPGGEGLEGTASTYDCRSRFSRFRAFAAISSVQIVRMGSKGS